MNLALDRHVERQSLLARLPMEDPERLSELLYQASHTRVVSWGERAVEGFLLPMSFLGGSTERYFLLILYKGPGVLYLYHTEETYEDGKEAFRQLEFLVRNYPLFGLSSRYRIR